MPTRIARSTFALQGVTPCPGASAVSNTDSTHALERQVADRCDAEADSLRSYTSFLAPPQPVDGVVTDWADPLSLEQRIYDVLLARSSRTVSVGVPGMGGLGATTALQLVCAHLAAKDMSGAHFPEQRWGMLVWAQLRRDTSEAAATALLLQAASHLEGRLVEGTGVAQAASLFGRTFTRNAMLFDRLMVLDDVWDCRLLVALQVALRFHGEARAGRVCALLFSTRLVVMATTDGFTTHVPLDGMSDAQSLQMLEPPQRFLTGGTTFPLSRRPTQFYYEYNIIHIWSSTNTYDPPITWFTDPAGRLRVQCSLQRPHPPPLALHPTSPLESPWVDGQGAAPPVAPCRRITQSRRRAGDAGGASCHCPPPRTPPRPPTTHPGGAPLVRAPPPPPSHGPRFSPQKVLYIKFDYLYFSR